MDTTEYEMMVILHPDVAGERVEEEIAALRGLISEHGHTVSEIIDWGRRRLAYPIHHAFEGHYVIAHYGPNEDARRPELDRALQLNETVLRHLIVHRDS